MGYKPTITNISAFDATQGTIVYFGWKGNAAFANELIIKNSETLEVVYQYRTERQMGLYHEMNISEGAKESFVNGKLYQATLIVYDKDNVASDESDPITFWCFSTPIFQITNDFVETGIVTMSSLYLNFKYKQNEKEALNEYTVKLYDSNNQLLHQSKTYNTSISDGELVYRIEGLQNTHEYRVCVEGITIHGMEVSTGYVLFSIKYDKMGAGALVNLKDIGDGKISIGSNFKILGVDSYPDPPKYIDNEEVDLRKTGSYVEFYDGFVVDGNYECKVAFRAPSVGNLYTMKNSKGDVICLSYEYYDIYNEEDGNVVRKYYFRLNVSGENTNVNIYSKMFDKLTYGQRVIALIQYKNGYYNLKLKISKDTTDAVPITYHIDQDVEPYTEMINVGDSIMEPASFVVEKEGYEFVGWRADSAASGEVLPEDTVADEELDLYAVFAKPVTLTCVSYDNTEVTSANMYYNNGVIENANIKIPVGSNYDSWVWKGWSDIDVTDANASVTYNNEDIISLSENAIIYGLYNQGIIVTYYNNSKTESVAPGTRCYNASGNILNPEFTLTQSGISGWTARGWSTGTSGNSSVKYKNAEKFSINSNITLYGMYEKSVTVTYYNNSTTKKTATDYAFRNYAGTIINAKFNLSQSDVSGWTKNGWSTSSVANASTTYNNATAFERLDDITLYGKYKKSVTASYNGNGNNSGSTSSNSGTAYRNYAGSVVGATITLSGSGFSKTNCTFSQWAVGSTGGTRYNSGSNVTLSENTTFYAVWKVNVIDNRLIASGKGSYQSDWQYSIDTTNYSSVKVRMWARSVWAYYGIGNGGDYNNAGKVTGTANDHPNWQYIDMTLQANSGVKWFSFGISPSGGYGGSDENTEWEVRLFAS